LAVQSSNVQTSPSGIRIPFISVLHLNLFHSYANPTVCHVLMSQEKSFRLYLQRDRDMAILCSRCDTKVLRPERCTVLDGKPCDACIEDMGLERKIQKLSVEIEKIQTMRRALRTTMNENHDRLIPKFPPEIISHMFLQHSPPSERFDKFNRNNPLNLGAVCQK